MLSYLRSARSALVALSILGLAVPAIAQQAPPARTIQTAEDPWLYKNSDLVHDTAWRFGRLPNGLRYVVRKNGVPPGQVAVRVRIDAGSLNETDSERGFAHLLEHLSFRGSVYVPDGDSKQIWQRLGVTFGSDSNASTTFTQTVYKLDLPSATESGLDESMKILAGMMYGPNITPATLNAERPVVLAEAREQPGAQMRLQDAMFDLMFAGQPLAKRKPIGTTETLNGATAESVKAFHDRWYRPERAVVVVVGDMDVNLLEQMVIKHFSSWKGTGPAPATPDFGKPIADGPTSATLVEPQIPVLTMLTVVRPWTVFSDTVIFNQKRMVDLVAIRIINRRLESRARTGGSFLAAGASLDDVGRSANVTTVQIMPVGENWETALKDVRGVIADAAASPPTQAEIDRELAEIESAMKNRINTAPVESGVSLAEDMIQAVDINETMTTPEASYDIFKEAVDLRMFTPETVQAASKKVFEGTATRAILNLHTADPRAGAKLTAALNADVSGSGKPRKELGNVTFDGLPALGTPGTVVSRETVLFSPKIEKVTFSNGVTLLIHENSSETSKVYVQVRFGRGLNALPANRRTPAWAGGGALVASGVGTYGQEELDALTGNRQIGFDFAIDDDAFVFSAQTTMSDLPDQLKLFAAKLASPAWDPNPVNRGKTASLSTYASLSASPDAVINRDLDSLLHSGDPRWGIPPKAAIAALTPASFRALWEPLLASGPIEVSIFGDLKTEEAIAAFGSTFGALKPRTASTVLTPPAKFPAHVAKPVVRTHTGQDDQAAAVIAWPTGGGSADIRESRRLEILAAVFRDRLMDQLRSQAGVSYSPSVMSDWPIGTTSGGKIMALGLLPPDKTDFFFQLTRSIAADLVAKPISQDELERAINPLMQTIIRRSSGNMFWLQLTQGGGLDPARIAAVNTLGRDYRGVTPEDIQALAVKYLVPSKDWTMVVVPEGKAPKPAAAPRAGVKRKK
ncbi:insulinase family protein [Sphingomonas sp. AOB5]|uniref:M16 family metallopeptidase n=1 Tax=Sphingomonas sp. AOB5 TaxID=3034017 RepID=UPI0023F64E19|nr:M16 family metallopeptidase [Sphingomonas sp. AOB5]MDF7773786.1 insulinase family protein [Sphingomonas sp. AOB5]